MTAPVKQDLPDSASLGFSVFSEPVKPYLQRLADFLQEEVKSFEEEIQPLVSYALENSGKRIRPILLFYSAWDHPPELGPSLVRAASVIELVHLATLVHDDILDESILRHRRLTIHRQYGSSIAVLLGDALFAHALSLASSFPTVDICREVSRATRQVCSGEIQQTFLRGDTGIELHQYFRIIELKTAELFQLSCSLGARLAGGTPDFVSGVETFGRHLGTAYQIFDDMADLYGDEGKIGKTLGTDLAKGKFTLPLLLFFREIPDSERDRLLEEIANERESVLPDLIVGVRDSGVLSEVHRLFLLEIEMARAALGHLTKSPAANRLLGLADFLTASMDRLETR